MYWPEMTMIGPTDVMDVLNEAGVRFMLMGNYGMTGWRGEPRATVDVDVLARQRDRSKAERAVRDAFPRLGVVDSTGATRFLDPAIGKPLIDLMNPTQPLFKVAFRQTVLVEGDYRIPNLELALACKYAAMMAPDRPNYRKFLDAADFISMVDHNPSTIRQARLRQLGEKVYQGGGAEVLQMVEDARAGRRLKF
jgi:hypothetical protein